MRTDWILFLLLSLLWLATGGLPWRALSRRRKQEPGSEDTAKSRT
jgi:hypothetical protein